MKAEKIKRLKNTMLLYLNVYGNYVKEDDLKNWFSKLSFFKPKGMSIHVGASGDRKRYKENVFLEKIHEVAKGKINSILGIDNGGLWSEAVLFPTSCRFKVVIPMEIWEERKDIIIRIYEEIFEELGGCFGFIVNRFDDEVVQNPSSADEYDIYGVDDSDFPNVRKIPIIPRKMPHWKDQIDPSFLPGKRLRYDEMTFTTAPYMWIGPDFFRFFPQDKIEKFRNCEENVEIAANSTEKEEKI